MASIFVYIVRHGQTAENVQGIIQGQLDTQLDAIGRLEQAPAVARALKDIPFEICLTSDLRRAVDTAQVILQYHPGVQLDKTVLLRERNMGNLQGLRGLPSGKKRRPLDDTVESPETFAARTLQFWDEMILPWIKSAGRTDPNRVCNALVVSHGAFIATLTRSLVWNRNVAMAPGLAVSLCPNASITLVEVRVDGTGTVLKYGDISHGMEDGAQGNVDELPA